MAIDDRATSGQRRRSSILRSLKSIADALTRPEVLTDLLQILKTVAAATLAWWLSVFVLDSQMPFLAPWAALLTVHATVHRSMQRGAQTIIASAAGVGLSFLIGSRLGVSAWTFALALFLGLAAARLSWIRDEGIAIATTAIFVLGSGFDSQQPLLLERILELSMGVIVGIAVNAALIPPLRDHQAARYVDSINRRMGELLTSMSESFASAWDVECAEEWFDETEKMSAELSSAWTTVRFARESRRANPRLRLRWALRRRRRSDDSEQVGYENILQRMDEGVSHLRNLARTLHESSVESDDWDPRFRGAWAQIVRDTGRSVADPDAEVEPIAERLDRLALELSGESAGSTAPGAGSLASAEPESLPRNWPLYGSLITSVRHIALVVDDVASARRARESKAENPHD